MLKRNVRAIAVSALVAGSLFASPSPAHAETVPPTAKGITGGAFLGGEIVVFGEAIFGVRSTAAYLVGAGAGAVAGGVGGYFLEQAVDDGRIPAYVLAGGLALLIPAVVVALDQTRYMPTEGARDDKPASNLPPSDPGQPGGSSVVGAEPAKPATPAPAPSGTTPPAGGTTPPAGGTTPPPTPPGGGGAPQSLFDLRGGDLRLGVPVPEVRPVFSASQAKALAVQNTGSELRFPVVRVTF